MKRYSLLIALSFLFLVPAVHSQRLNGLMDHHIYRDAEGYPYIEAYALFDGSSLQYVTLSNGLKQAEVEVAYIISRGADILAYDKFVLQSASYAADIKTFDDLIDIRKIAADTGEVVMETYIMDLNSGDTAYITIFDTLYIHHNTSDAEVSGIRLIDSYTPATGNTIFTKGNMDLVPSFFDVIGGTREKIAFYAEIYNTANVFGDKGKYIITSYIENYQTNLQLESYTSVKREYASELKPYLAEFNVKDLPSGYYNIVIEVRDSLNQLRDAERFFFVRENPALAVNYEDMSTISIENTFAGNIQDPDSLKDIIRSLYPIASNTETSYAKNVLKNGDPDLMRQFLYSFFLNRNQADPATEYYNYRLEVMKVNNTFTVGNTEGYASDRGRVYLKYGPPDQRSERPSEPDNYPYEIWQYYKLRGQTNVKFVFYMPDEGLTQYYILHSDLRGEPQNRRWQVMLSQRSSSFTIDQVDPMDNYGNWSGDLYNNPR